MSSKPKIVVFKLREIIYTLVLLFLVVLLTVCLFLMFTGRSKETVKERTAQPVQTQDNEAEAQSTSEPASYTPGVYKTSVTLGSSAAEVEVTVDADHINAIRLVNLSETAAAAYPLVTPSLDHIASQILETQSLEGITAPQENRYTSQMLLLAISDALEIARTGGQG